MGELWTSVLPQHVSLLARRLASTLASALISPEDVPCTKRQPFSWCLSTHKTHAHISSSSLSSSSSTPYVKTRVVSIDRSNLPVGRSTKTKHTLFFLLLLNVLFVSSECSVCFV